jgi:hypothetical protein
MIGSFRVTALVTSRDADEDSVQFFAVDLDGLGVD